MSELDKDFVELATKINAKLKEAAAALKEANELADKAKLPGLINSQFIYENMRYDGSSSEEINTARDEFEEKYQLIDVSDLEEELGNGGWSTSSSYC